MRCKSALLLLMTSCTPMEREIAEEVIHEVEVAEHAIEEDLEENPFGAIPDHDFALQGRYNSDTLPPATQKH